MSNEALIDWTPVLERAEPTRRVPELPASGESLIAELLRDQRDLSAVERFAQQHAHAVAPVQSKYYRDLIPLTTPGPGEQYAFEVDLDACTGCKACVTACHSLNGLDEGETWRAVGQIVSSDPQLPLMKMVTAACHHCAHPACMDGCPVKAYDKDLLTGIVKHLDDQCIGCQYCILKCPYDVPKYSASRGIVRKCDMCSSRLEKQEAPACVQACPNTAIRITTVSREKIVERSRAAVLVPSAPKSDYTLPSTIYRSQQPLPELMNAGDATELSPAHSHMALVWTLVLTQFAAGGMLAASVLSVNGDARPARITTIASLALHLIGMHCALLHLGRPLFAFRAILGLRTSWLSREVAAFGAVAAVDSAALFLPALLPVAVVVSLVAVFCSVMIYADTRRPFWRFSLSATRFYLSVLCAGGLSSLAAAAFSRSSSLPTFAALAATLCGLKLALELRYLLHASNAEATYDQKSARLMRDHLRTATIARFVTGIVGGIALPLLATFMTERVVAMVAVAAALWLVSELCERYLYFTAVVPLKMPGGLAR